LRTRRPERYADIANVVKNPDRSKAKPKVVRRTPPSKRKTVAENAKAKKRAIVNAVESVAIDTTMNERTGNKLRMAKVERKTRVIGYAIKRDLMRSAMGRT